MQHLDGSGTPVLYIGRKVLKGYGAFQYAVLFTYHLSGIGATR